MGGERRASYSTCTPSIYRWGKLRSRRGQVCKHQICTSTSQRHLLPPKTFHCFSLGKNSIGIQSRTTCIVMVQSHRPENLHLSPQTLKAWQHPKSSWQEKRKVPIRWNAHILWHRGYFWCCGWVSLLLALSRHLLDHTSTAIWVLFIP